MTTPQVPILRPPSIQPPRRHLAPASGPPAALNASGGGRRAGGGARLNAGGERLPALNLRFRSQREGERAASGRRAGGSGNRPHPKTPPLRPCAHGRAASAVSRCATERAAPPCPSRSAAARPRPGHRAPAPKLRNPSHANPDAGAAGEPGSPGRSAAASEPPSGGAGAGSGPRPGLRAPASKLRNPSHANTDAGPIGRSERAAGRRSRSDSPATVNLRTRESKRLLTRI